MPGKSQSEVFSGQPLFSKQITRQLRDMIAFGAVANWYYVGVRCHNNAVGTTAEDLWGAGGVMVYPSTAAAGSIVSTSTDDADGGTGTSIVTVRGLDADYREVSETVTLDGTTPVATTLSYIRVNSMRSTSAGSGDENAGDITISVGGNVQRFIEAGSGICHCSQYTVPAGHTAYVMRMQASAGKDGAADVWIAYREFDDGGWVKVNHLPIYRNTAEVELDGSVIVGEKTDVKMLGAADVGSVNVAGYYVLYLVEAR